MSILKFLNPGKRKLVPLKPEQPKVPGTNTNSNRTVVEAKKKTKKDVDVKHQTRKANRRISKLLADEATARMAARRERLLKGIQERPVSLQLSDAYASSHGEIKDGNQAFLDKAMAWYGLSNGLGLTTNISDRWRATPSFANFVGRSTPEAMTMAGSLVANPVGTILGMGTGYLGSQAGGYIGELLGNREAGEMVGSLVGMPFGFKTGRPGDVFINSRRMGNTNMEAAVDALASTKMGKRAAEVAMRSRYDTHATSNPVPDLILGWTHAPGNRRRAVANYILTGGLFNKTRNKPFGYQESLAPFKQKNVFAPDKLDLYFDTQSWLNKFGQANWWNKGKMLFGKRQPYDRTETTYNWGEYTGEPEVAYTGGFWTLHLPREKGYGDAIDAYLYGTEINPAYGMRRISVGKPKDFGMHESIIAEKYPERVSKVQVYETEPHAGDDVVTNAVEPRGYSSDGSGDIATSTSRFDAGGHWREQGLVLDDNGQPIPKTTYDIYRNGILWLRDYHSLPKGIENRSDITYITKSGPLKAYRSQDLWHYNSNKGEGYLKKWGPESSFSDDISLSQLGKWGELGIRLIDKAGNPFITRTPWRTLPIQYFHFPLTINR